MIAKPDAVRSDAAKFGEREHLVAAAVGEDGPLPAHEAVEPAEELDDLQAGTEIEMIRVSENDRGPQFLAQLVGRNRFDRTLRAHRHECRRLDDASRSGELASSGLRLGICLEDAKHGPR